MLLHISQNKRGKRKETKKRSSKPCWEFNNDTYTILKEGAGRENSWATCEVGITLYKKKKTIEVSF
jgi:hypothetical protein